MSRKVTITLSKASADWLRRRNDYDDKDRAVSAAAGLTRYLWLWEFVKSSNGQWVTVAECGQFLFGECRARTSARRQARRMLYTLAETGLVECQYGLPNKPAPTRVRLNPKWREWQ